MTSLARARKGWTVRVAYPGQDRELKWGDFHHSQKAKARNVFNNLKGSAERIQVLKDGKLQFEVRRALLVQGDEFDTPLMEAFLNDH